MNLSVGPSQIRPTCVGAPENQHRAMSGSQEWMSRSTDLDSSACLPTLKPPDNPLSSINLQPIEPPVQTLSPLKIPSPVSYNVPSPAKLSPLSTLVPPKLIPGESEEDFLKRKREYWRIKKKEQRARKAIRERGITPRRATSSWRPILPARDLPPCDLPTQVQATQVKDKDLNFTLQFVMWSTESNCYRQDFPGVSSPRLLVQALFEMMPDVHSSPHTQAICGSVSYPRRLGHVDQRRRRRRGSNHQPSDLFDHLLLLLLSRSHLESLV